jgi:hypothetical protein
MNSLPREFWVVSADTNGREYGPFLTREEADDFRALVKGGEITKLHHCRLRESFEMTKTEFEASEYVDRCLLDPTEYQS